jgi:hypothetical protein
MIEEEEKSPTEEQRRDKSPATTEGRDIDLPRVCKSLQEEQQEAVEEPKKHKTVIAIERRRVKKKEELILLFTTTTYYNQESTSTYKLVRCYHCHQLLKPLN